MSTSVPFPLPTDTAPMEAKRADAIPDDQGVWQYEPKWDGFRCLAFKAGDAVDIRAKSGKPLARYFPELVEFLRNLSGAQIVIDGEILIECCGEYSFDALQMRLHPAESRIRKLAAETPAKLMLFDMLADQTGQILTDRPLCERRAALEALVKSIGNAGIELSPATLDLKQAQKWLRDSDGKTDGVIAKQLDGPYLPGERAMVKVKRRRTADCVVGGFRYLAERREVGSLLLGLYDEDGKLDHVGFTSTISNDERAALTGRLEALRESPGFTGNAPGGPSRWSTERSGEWEPLRPELVVEVRFDHVTGNRFRHGTKLLRWRPDKAPRQCTFDQLR
ncbi:MULTISPECIES: ATP-dependent DNA ligase [unclassified Mesorhizobium]|uniref:ATP-dependent DNA ligase n=1 Tax=unclassified Mesorhizobium TaxID=325217 RepID=UPI00112E9713|nr:MULTISPECIES: ATP-dependent DNA ligase [unclassified Mesorhizobium]MBZ9811306.1 ATP-dependent DNA ligase [Mesorhizobium sp. ESP-6-2]TPM25878.1 ATP-dependent DNA ligase [Mesorhizobium sp. B2-2-2]